MRLIRPPTRSGRHGRQLAAPLAGALLSTSCGGGPGSNRDDIAIVPLEAIGVVLEPDTTGATSRLGAAYQLSLDSVSGHLYAIDKPVARVVELDRSGTPIRAYASPGEGPGQLRYPTRIAARGGTVFVLDMGNQKLVGYRAPDSVVTEWTLPQHYQDFALFGDSGLAFVPGAARSAVDLYTTSGTATGGVGARGVLPHPCVGCLLAVLADSSFAVVEPFEGVVVVIGPDRQPSRSLRFDRYEFFRRWRKVEERELSAEARRTGDPPGRKSWVIDVFGAGRTGLALVVSPARAHVDPNELWLVDVTGGLQARYRFDRPGVGIGVAVPPGSRRAEGGTGELFATDVETGGIYRYRLPTASSKRPARAPASADAVQ